MKGLPVLGFDAWMGWFRELSLETPPNLSVDENKRDLPQVLAVLFSREVILLSVAGTGSLGMCFVWVSVENMEGHGNFCMFDKSPNGDLVTNVLLMLFTLLCGGALDESEREVADSRLGDFVVLVEDDAVVAGAWPKGIVKFSNCSSFGGASSSTLCFDSVVNPIWKIKILHNSNSKMWSHH